MFVSQSTTIGTCSACGGDVNEKGKTRNTPLRGVAIQTDLFRTRVEPFPAIWDAYKACSQCGTRRWRHPRSGLCPDCWATAHGWRRCPCRPDELSAPDSRCKSCDGGGFLRK